MHRVTARLSTNGSADSGARCVNMSKYRRPATNAKGHARIFATNTGFEKSRNNISTGAMLPSVRGLAERYDVNPLTAAKAYRELQREGLVEALRGEGLIVRDGVRAGLMKRERARFLKEEWPQLRARLERLEVDVRMLFSGTPE
jgi:DNA-binding transcriptional regulator YhcF (GntR family)